MAAQVVKLKERRKNPIDRCSNDMRDKIAHASINLLIKRLMVQQEIKEAGSILWQKCVNLFITLIIIGSVINAIWLVFGCTLKVRPMGRTEGYGIEFVLSKNETQKKFNRNLDLVIFEKGEIK